MRGCVSETCRVDGVGVALGFHRCGYHAELKATTPRWHLKRAAPDIVGYGGRARFTTCAVQRAEKWRRGGWLGLIRFDGGGRAVSRRRPPPRRAETLWQVLQPVFKLYADSVTALFVWG